jgi:hypothetical protein
VSTTVSDTLTSSSSGVPKAKPVLPPSAKYSSLIPTNISSNPGTLAIVLNLA